MRRGRECRFPAAAVAALLLLGGHPVRASAPERVGPSATACEAFHEDGRGAILIRIARDAFAAAALGREVLPESPSPGLRRPAGPRDEPPPPEWPPGPVGFLLCLRVGESIRGCEGDSPPSRESLGRIASALGERLASSSSRGRRPDPEDLDRAELDAWFLIPLERMDYTGFKAAVKSGEVGLAGTALVVNGGRGRAFVAPGEARGAGDAARIARRAGASRLFGRPGSIELFRPVAAAPPVKVIRKLSRGSRRSSGPARLRVCRDRGDRPSRPPPACQPRSQPS